MMVGAGESFPVAQNDVHLPLVKLGFLGNREKSLWERFSWTFIPS